MTDYEKDQFWQALGRLYDSVLELRARAERDSGRIDKLLTLAEKDGENIHALARIAEAP